MNTWSQRDGEMLSVVLLIDYTGGRWWMRGNCGSLTWVDWDWDWMRICFDSMHRFERAEHSE